VSEQPRPQTEVVAGEFLFSVEGAQATVVSPVSLQDAGLQERRDLQEWILDHPEVLGDDVTIVTSEFGRWIDGTGAVERDRLDILGLDAAGHPVVVELKRDKAPDTVDMQALKYAALVSRFTLPHLGAAHADYLRKRDPDRPVTDEQALALLTGQSAVDDQTLRAPRIILMAASFPRTVTATVVYLNQSLGLDVRLLAFKAYRTGGQVLLTISQLYPPLEVADFVLNPEIQRRRDRDSEESARERDLTSVARIIAGDLLEIDAPLAFAPPAGPTRDRVTEWVAADPARGTATWNNEATEPLTWSADHQRYSPTRLAQVILHAAAGREGPVPGPNYWQTEDGITLYALARPASGALSPVDRAQALTGDLAEAFETLNDGLLALTPPLTRKTRVALFSYSGSRKLCDLSFHLNHLSLYVLGMTGWAALKDDVVIGGRPEYAHLQVRDRATALRALSHVTDVYRQTSASKPGAKPA
jgi:hypothetical protein